MLATEITTPASAELSTLINDLTIFSLKLQEKDIIPSDLQEMWNKRKEKLNNAKREEVAVQESVNDVFKIDGEINGVSARDSMRQLKRWDEGAGSVGISMPLQQQVSRVCNVLGRK
jgi:hypothetical protein